jgi:hypothetical protein
MAQPFVKIDGHDLKLMTDMKFSELASTRVVSILGKARMGKSSFLNCLAYQLTKENKMIFTTKGTFEHVTKGVDFYHLPQHNLILLDSQGLDHEDSSHDPILLLFVYLISDIIIFNGTQQLQNDTLKLLEPICAFMHSVDLDDIVKPHLFFRIANAFPVVLDDPHKSLDTINVSYNDQYQSIRDSIKLLFQDDIDIVATEHLGKSSTAYIDEGTYKPLLDNKENGFAEAIEKILTSLEKPSEKKNQYLTKLPEVIKQINNNEKINISKLDVVALTTSNEILQWLQNVEQSDFSVIEVDGLQKTFMERVEPRKAKKKAILTAFTKRFKSVPEKIKQSYYTELSLKLSAPIDKAINESETKAEGRVGYISGVVKRDHEFESLNSSVNSFTSIERNFNKKKCLYQIYKFADACTDLYEPVKERYVKWCNGIYKAFDDTLDKMIKAEAEEMTAVDLIYKNILDNYISESTEYINQCTSTNILLQSNEEITHKIRQDKFAETRRSILDILKVREVTGCIKGAMPFFTTSYNSSRTSAIEAYDLTISNWSQFVTDIIKLSNKTMVDWTSKKKEMLYGKKFDLSNVSMPKMLDVNPEIEFIQCDTIRETMTDPIKVNVSYKKDYMTIETYNNFYLPIIYTAVNKMISKGYTDISWQWYSNSTNMTHKNLVNRKQNLLSTAYSNNLITILNNQVMKIYCKAVTLGTEFPTDLNILADDDSDLIDLIGFFKRAATAQGQVGLRPVAEQSS